MREDGQVRVKYEELENFCRNVFLASGLSNEDASIVARALVEQNLRGVDTHGVRLVTPYVAKLIRGGIEPRPVIRTVSEVGVVKILDGGNALGQVAAYKAVMHAVNLAKKFGVGVVGVRNSNHFGSASYFTEIISSKRQIGIAMSNAPPTVAPWGGCEARLGTNPISISVPTGVEHPPSITLDMATSAVSRSKLFLQYKDDPEKEIPEGLALNKEGDIARTVKEALEGVLLPVAGPKGYGLSLMADIFSAVLTGSSFGLHVGWLVEDSETPQRVGHFIVAISIEHFIEIPLFEQRLNRLMSQIKSARPAKGAERVYLPGEIEFYTALKRRTEGIILPRTVYNDLIRIGAELGIEDMPCQCG